MFENYEMILDFISSINIEKNTESAYIPASAKVLGNEEKALMIQAVLDGWLTTGRFNSEFEKKLKKRIGVKHLLTVNSGSSANLVAFMALTSRTLGEKRIKPGDEVITVAAGFPTTVNPIILAGAIPVFVDVEQDTYNVNYENIKSSINKKTKAIFIAHTLGNPFDAKKIKKLADDNNLFMIEDCCDALGASIDGKHVGTYGDIGTLSFYPAHHITMGEGGAVFTSDHELKRIIESFRDWGRDCYCDPGRDNTCRKRYSWKYKTLPDGYDHKYVYSHLGFNLKITDMQAACGLAQLDKLDHFIKMRNGNFNFFLNGLRGLKNKIYLPKTTHGAKPSWFGFPITLKEDNSRLRVTTELEKAGIGTRMLFGGDLRRQPYMEEVNYITSGSMTVTERILEKTFWFGVHPGIDDEKRNYMLENLLKFL